MIEATEQGGPRRLSQARLRAWSTVHRLQDIFHLTYVHASPSDTLPPPYPLLLRLRKQVVSRHPSLARRQTTRLPVRVLAHVAQRAELLVLQASRRTSGWAEVLRVRVSWWVVASGGIVAARRASGRAEEVGRRCWERPAAEGGFTVGGKALVAVVVGIVGVEVRRGRVEVNARWVHAVAGSADIVARG